MTVLSVSDLSARYGRALALDSVNLVVEENETVGIQGENGAGKTTLLRAISGVHSNVTGKVTVCGTTATSVFGRTRQGVSFVREGALVFAGMTVGDHLRLGWRLADLRKVARVPEEQLWKWFPALSSRRGDYSETLSGGQRQMLAILVALASGPSLLLLDEPSAGLAFRAADQIFAAFDEMRADGRQLAVVLAEQDPQWIEAYCHGVHALKHGHMGPRLDARRIGVSPRKMSSG